MMPRRGGVAEAKACVHVKAAGVCDTTAGTKVQLEDGDEAPLVHIDGFVPVDQLPAPPLLKVLSWPSSI